MNKEVAVELVVGGIILAALAGLGALVFNMKGDLGAVGIKVTATAERVDRIAAALPDMRIRVAADEISKTLHGAVVATVPRQLPAGEVAYVVHVFDFDKKQRTTYSATVSERAYKNFRVTLAGDAVLGGEYTSLSELERFSSDAGKRVTVPAYIDADASFVSRDSAAKAKTFESIKKALSEIDRNPQTVPLEVTDADYGVFIKELEVRRREYEQSREATK